MGSSKRERQKQGRQARVEAAREAEKRANMRRRLTVFGSIAAVVALLVGVYVWRTGGDDEVGSDTTATTLPAPDTTGPPDPAAPVTIAPDTPCVGLDDTLPEGAPEFAVPTGVPSGELEVEDLTVGDGAEAEPGGDVTIHYVGVSCSTGKVFDSSYSRGEPATFNLGGLIAGWQEGIPGMQVGGQRLLVIPPDLGYGEFGSPPNIAGGETLVFFVELVDVPA